MCVCGHAYPTSINRLGSEERQIKHGTNTEVNTNLYTQKCTINRQEAKKQKKKQNKTSDCLSYNLTFRLQQSLQGRRSRLKLYLPCAQKTHVVSTFVFMLMIIQNIVFLVIVLLIFLQHEFAFKFFPSKYAFMCCRSNVSLSKHIDNIVNNDCSNFGLLTITFLKIWAS